ncbi:partial putative chromosome-partitioning protein ParB, partial [Gammaproteobacteria bacterium]
MNENQLTAQVILLDQVYPDPQQPRRLLPPDLGQLLANGALPIDILEQLRARAGQDKWIREKLLELDTLADSIGVDGLMQPIRVIPDGDNRYRIEEGERRWWAHHILVEQGKEQFRHIAAFIVEGEHEAIGLLRRRVAENVLRSGFTAIELARAMASRIQEIMNAEPGTKQGEAERRVGNENGMSDRRVRQFVALLTLSPEAQEMAQQARLTENSLRPIVGNKNQARQMEAIRELLHPTRPKENVRKSLRPKQHSQAIRSAQLGKHSRRRSTRVLGKSSKKRITRKDRVSQGNR